jgi:long-chain fatty acid transport protein
MIYQNGNRQPLHLWLNSTTFGSMPESTNLDVPIVLDFKRNFALNWSVGLSYEPLPGLSIGGSFRGKRSIRADGTLDIGLPEYLTDLASVTGNKIQIEINTPPIARVGVEYALPKIFKLEGAFVYEGWRTYRSVVVRPVDVKVAINSGGMSMEQQLEKIVQPRNWESTFSLRLGGEVTVLEPLLTARAGYFFEPSAIPENRVDPSRIDFDKHGFALGLGTTFFGVSLDVAAMYIALAGAEVRNSEVASTGPLKPPLGSDRLLTTVGNGNYDAHYVLGSASLSFALDPLLGL